MCQSSEDTYWKYSVQSVEERSTPKWMEATLHSTSIWRHWRHLILHDMTKTVLSSETANIDTLLAQSLHFFQVQIIVIMMYPWVTKA